jgi:ribonuclease HI
MGTPDASTLPGQAVTVVYTDGACSRNPGPGGWAWAVPGGRFTSGAAKRSTNQRMEITAVLVSVSEPAGRAALAERCTVAVTVGYMAG